MRKVLIFGATSAIAQATSRLFAEAGDRLCLVARDAERLDAVRNDLQVRGADAVSTEILDINCIERHDKIIERSIDELGGLDVVLIAHGTLPEQTQCEDDTELMLNEIKTNAISTVALLSVLARHMEFRGEGVLAVITSVAGDRGRQSNYVYGAAKGMVTVFLQGLRNRLHPSGVRVLTIKPGFVDTPMTAQFKKGLLWSDPANVARGIYAAIQGRADVVYVPFYWRYLMLFIKAIPESIFKRLSL